MIRQTHVQDGKAVDQPGLELGIAKAGYHFFHGRRRERDVIGSCVGLTVLQGSNDSFPPRPRRTPEKI